MTSTFEQSVTTTVINGGFTYGVYFWSTAANWVGGVPTDGGLVEHDITVSGNPSGYDDIAGLSLDSLLIDAGQVAVGGSLEIGTLSFGTVNFPSIYSDTLLGSSAATLVVDGFGGSNFGEIGAFGTHALTVVQSLTDPGGETYQVDDGGELLLVPTPQYNSSVISAGFYYENSVASGTFAFRNPSATITSPLGGVAIGDAIALPGTDVSSVTYGSNSIAVVTNEGTVDFSNVGYSGTRPAGFVATPDPISGLERITFASQQVTGFQQGQTTQIVENGFTFGVYLWSTAANWTNGVPDTGAAVTHNITVAGNPSGYDDLAGLFLDSVAVTAGQIAVGGSLEIGSVSFGTANFPSIYSDTLLGSSAATLVVDGFSGSNFGEIGAFGTHALTVVQSLTDPGGETYQVDDGGELLLVPTPQYNSSVFSAGFYYENSVASGTFAFRNPSGTIASPLGGVAIGDAIALPGTDVSSVTYGSNSIAIVTNKGTVDFSNVSYSGTHPTGFVATPDVISGLEQITFASQQNTSFQQSQTTQIVENGFTFGVYLWSTAANWTNGAPGAGAAVTHNITVPGNPSGYDDVAGLFLDSVAVTAGQIAVGGSLEIGSISFGTANFPSIYSDTLLGSSSATLVVDGFSGSNFGEIGAFGTHALTVVQSLTDPGGETYQVDDGGELLLVPTPQYNSSVFSAGLYYENSVASGTFAFRNPSATITSPLGGVAIGDAIALPGTDVSSVTYGSNSIAVVTNEGTVDFSNVSYSGTRPTGFVATPDPISGLERITFASQQVTGFQQGQTTQIVENGFTFGVYLWSTAANWTNGVPDTGAAVTHNITVAGNPSGYDDLAGLFLDSVAVTAGQIAVGGSLEIGSVSFGTDNFPSIYSDTLLGSSAATLVVDGFSGSNFGEIGAFGTHALTVVQSLTDPGGETYQVDDGGELLLVPTPQYNSSVFSAGLYYENSVASGTFAFRNPSATITSPLGGVAIGDAIALPGTDVSSVTYSDVANQGTITVVTNVGTTTFNNVGYVPNEVFTGYTAATDPISGLERITFAGYQTTSFQQGQTTQIVENGFTFGVYLWSTAANWTNGIPSSGEGVTHNITVPGNPSGYDDIADLDLASVLVTAGQIAVGGSLEIGALSFGTANFPSIYSDTLAGEFRRDAGGGWVQRVQLRRDRRVWVACADRGAESH